MDDIKYFKYIGKDPGFFNTLFVKNQLIMEKYPDQLLLGTKVQTKAVKYENYKDYIHNKNILKVCSLWKNSLQEITEEEAFILILAGELHG